VKKTFAERYITRYSNRKSHRQKKYIQACADAARENIKLARWVLKINPYGKLLQAGLHFVFNAAIILLLQDLGSLDVAPSDKGNVSFAISVFEEESKTGSNYAKDCTKVLQDLRFLVQRLQLSNFDEPGNRVTSLQPILKQVQEPAERNHNLGDKIMANLAPMYDTIASPQSLVGDGDTSYQAFVAWTENDDFQMYNKYLI
jgi:hypothetical protein